MHANIVLILLRSVVFLAASTSANWENVREVLQSENRASLPFDTSVVSSAKCREDLEYWSSSLQQFIGAVQLQCEQNDTQCTDIKTQITTETTFAAEQYDSFGRLPVNLLNMNTQWQGSWEECIHITAPAKSDYKAHFCWMSLATPLTLAALGQSGFSETLCTSMTLSQLLTQWSVCMPRSCEDQDITALFRVMNNSTQGLIMFCGSSCRLPGPPKKDGGFWVVIAYCIIGLFLIVSSTIIDYLSDCESSRCKRLRNGVGMKCLLTFSMYTNGAEILDTEKRPGQIHCLHCIRVFSMTWVMLGHVLMHFMYSEDLLKMLEQNRYFLNLAFTNAFFSVDSFLFLGGLLMTYMFIKAMDKNPSTIRSPVYWILFYVHRIVRLSPPYYLFMGLTIVMYDFLTVGPMQMSFIETMVGCRRTWWRNVLYINNLWDLNNMCMGHAWYLALDMQIHIFAPLLLVPLFFSTICGLVAAALLLAVSTALNYWAYYHFDSPATLMGFFTGGSMSLDEDATVNYEMNIYFASWVRYTPYVIGGLTGYFLYKTRNKRLKLHPIYAVLFWLGSIAIGIGCVYGLYDYVKGQYWSKFERATYYNFSRIFWSVALSWIVIACENNWAGPIKNFMEMPFWAPLGRLTYCAYLTHYFIIAIILATSRQPIHYVNPFHLYIKSLSVFVISYAFSFVWSCTFEVPIGKLEKMALGALLSSGAPRRSRNADGEFAGRDGTRGQPQKQQATSYDVAGTSNGDHYETKHNANANDDALRRRQQF